MSKLRSIENVLVGTVVGVFAAPILHQIYHVGWREAATQFAVELAAMMLWSAVRGLLVRRAV